MGLGQTDYDTSEEDVDVGFPVATSGRNVQTMAAEGSDVDAEGEEVDDEEDESEPVGAVKAAGRNPALDEDEDATVESSDAKSSGSDDNDSSSSSESDAENEWEAESDAAGGAEAEIIDPNRCMWVVQTDCVESASADIIAVFVQEEKRMIQARNLKNTLHALCAEITVSGILLCRNS